MQAVAVVVVFRGLAVRQVEQAAAALEVGGQRDLLGSFSGEPLGDPKLAVP